MFICSNVCVMYMWESEIFLKASELLLLLLLLIQMSAFRL